MKEYWKKIYKTRYFWSHLAKNDLLVRFRRSKLGIMWVVIQPFILTIIMTLVFSTVFGQELGEYLLYILSGIVVWDLLSASTISAGNSLMASEQYIRQFNHPITIYTLRSSLLNTTIFVIEINALIIWCLFMEPVNILFGLITLPLTALLYFMLAWALSTIAAYANTKYRDYPQIMSLVMQAIWYVSPVFFKKEQFSSNQLFMELFDLNPITHILNLVREPFLYGRMPGVESYLFVSGCIIFFAVWAYRMNKRNEKTIIFYL